jgi:DNA polymerase III delta subunit
MEHLHTQQQVDDHIENHKASLKTFEKSFGFKKKTITLPTFMWQRMLTELSTSSVFSDRLYITIHDNYGIPKDQVEWDTELMMGIEQLQKKLK